MISAAFVETNIAAAIWRDLARQSALVASQLRDPNLRLSMLAIAAGYETMAERADAMAQAEKSEPPATDSERA
jgi:hypothetical protein